MEKSKGKASKQAQQAINPPDGWALQSPFGYMRVDATPAGLLVRLADVLHWLEKTNSLPRVAALEEMCKVMPPDVVTWLYWVQPTDYAKPVPLGYMWGYRTAEQIDVERKADINARIQRAWQREHELARNGMFGATSWFKSVGKPTAIAPPEPTEPGLPALVKILGKYWKLSRRTRHSTCDILDDPTMASLVNLAIPLDRAAAIWGYGCSDGDQQKNTDDKQIEWTGELLMVHQATLKAKGEKAFTQKLSELSGLTDREITRRIKASRDKKPVTNWTGIAVVSGKKSKKISKG
jgi:hypothetical protein